jgi:hypothetical protein
MIKFFRNFFRNPHLEAARQSLDKIEETLKTITKVSKGTIVQITNPNHHWFPVLLIVDEVQPWGVIAYCFMPQTRDTVSRAPIRLSNDDFKWAGQTVVDLDKYEFVKAN